MRFYLTYKDHGLYDPVVDDTEVIYIPVDPEELRIVNIETNIHKTETNIHDTQQKTEIIDFNQTGEPARLVQPVVEFLTDPDIEDLPLLINVDDIPPEGKFRLPVSENYDPEGKRVKLDKIKGKAVETFNVKNKIDEANEERIRLQQAQDAVSDYISESKIKQNNEIKVDLCQTEKETDVHFVREKALEVVSESIDRAISVANEINENVKTDIKTSEDLAELITKKISNSFQEKTSQSVNIQKESVKNIEYDVKVSEEISKFENLDTQTTRDNIEERRLLTKQEIDDTIQSGTVRRTSEIFNKENIEISKSYGIEMNKNDDSFQSERDESRHRESSAKQRAFSIGLQTIPHIRENINSSKIDYRINLLTTFFLQLTNIMVTLSRFIGTEPKNYLTQDAYAQRQEQCGFEKKEEKAKFDKSKEHAFESFEQREEGQGLSKYKYEHVSNDSQGELIRKGKLSGAKIAQIEGRKTIELTDKMDIVISEFQKKSGFEEQSHDQFFQSPSRSRSKMKSEENIFYGESQKQSHSNHKKTYEEFSETKTQSHDIFERSEKHTLQSETTKTEAKPYPYETNIIDGKNLTYVAIVEAHVYTNKEAIFEEQMRREREIKTQNIEKTEMKTKQDIRKLSLADTILIPQTEEMAVNEIKDEVIKIEKGVPGIEQSTIKIAAKKISEVLEPLIELTSDTSHSVKQAHTIIEEPFKSVVQSTDVSTEEFQQYFSATTVLSQKIYPSLEKPTKSVVEITEIAADENESQNLDVLKLIVAKPKSIIEDVKPIAETIEVSIKEDELALLDESKPHIKQPTLLLEESAFSVALKSSVSPVEPKSNIEIFEKVEQTANVKFDEFKVALKSSISPVEPKSNIEIFEKVEQTANVKFDEFKVALKSSISPVEPKSNIEIFEKVEQTANVNFDELKAVESTIINLEEPGNDIFETPETLEKYPLISIEDPHLTIAEVFTILPDEPKNENFEVSRITECKTSIDVVETKAAETIIIRPEEPKYEPLEILKIEEKIPEATFEGSSLKLAEIISMIPEESKDEFYVPEVKNQQAGITIIEINAAEATVVEAMESKQPELNIEQPKEKRTKQIIEPSSLSVAEVFTTTIAESSKLIPKAENIKNQLAHVGVEQYKAIETIEVALGDLTYNKLAVLLPEAKQLKTSVEESVQSVAQTTEVYLTDAENKMSITSNVTTKAQASSAIEAIKTTEIVKSEVVGRPISPTLPLSPITPVVEEYMFSLEAQLEHPYVVEEAVSEEASLRIKNKKMEIQSADTTYTLAIESIVEADSETIEEIEEIENIHLSKEVHKSMYEGHEAKKSAKINVKSLEANQVMSTEAHSLDAHHKLSINNQTMMQDAVNISSLETNQNVSTAAINLGDSYKMSLEKAAVVEGASMSSQASHTSQSSLHKSRKVISSESQYSDVHELESSVKSMQSGSLESSIKVVPTQYVQASNKQLSISASKSMESKVLEGNIELETHQHLRTAGSSYKAAASESVESKSFGTVESVSQFSSQVIKGESNASLINEKLTLRTDLQNTISDGSQSSSPLPVPPTPLTDEYIFRLQTELPEESTFIPRDCSISPESMHEDVVVNGLLTNYKTKIEDRILYNPPLPTPPTSPEKTKPVYTKPGLKGGSMRQELSKEEIYDSSLVSAIDRTLKQIEEYKVSVGITTEEMSYHQEDVDKEFVPIHAVEEWLDNEAVHEKAENSQLEEDDAIKITIVTEENNEGETAITITTNNMDNNDLEIQEISSNFDVIPLEGIECDEVLNEQMSSESILDDFKSFQIDTNENLKGHEEDYEYVAVHPSSLNNADDGSFRTAQFETEVLNVNAQNEGKQTLTTDTSQELVMLHDQEIIGEEPIIPPVESLKNSEVIKLLNEERTAVEERKWTTFLQKKYTPPPKTEVVYYGDFDIKTQFIPDAYKIKIVKQPKPKIAPDWKPEELKKESSPIIEISEPEATEGTEIQETIEQDNNIIEEEDNIIKEENNIVSQEDNTATDRTEIVEEYIDKESEELELEEMAQRNLAEELIKNVENMIDINAPTEQQLEQMRDQLAALAQLPAVIQQTVELVNKRIHLISQREHQKKKEDEEYRKKEEEYRKQEDEYKKQEEEKRVELEKTKQSLEMRVAKTEEALAIIQKENEVKRILEAKIRGEKQKKENMERMKIDQESRQVTQRSTPRMGKPMPLFGPFQERPVILPGGRKWRTPEDVFDEELINETLVGQAEVIKGTAIGVNFRKFDKPPPPLDHLKHSEVFKAIHDIEPPTRKVELLGPVLSEADYRERARSMSPCVEKVAESTHTKQFHP